jgi:hypothetical protein
MNVDVLLSRTIIRVDQQPNQPRAQDQAAKNGNFYSYHDPSIDCFYLPEGPTLRRAALAKAADLKDAGSGGDDAVDDRVTAVDRAREGGTHPPRGKNRKTRISANRKTVGRKRNT